MKRITTIYRFYHLFWWEIVYRNYDETYVDKFASEADGIVVLNRVKPHTAFRGPVESGVMKLISIGLGNGNLK
ncbi:hypothetical protein [Bacillus sp. FSL K6-3431]|uniref:hypothetical protein n=1 Tax=Bacillus sp. FSL K6-3431 TaxID=2921500 RepID=UPI0030F6C324